MVSSSPASLALIISSVVLAASVASSVSAQLQPSASPPPECLPIDSTLSCAPWNQGYFINTTELGLVYGLSNGANMPNVSYWDSLITASTGGGQFQAQLWQNWAQCSGYKGEPIQYSRTYVCLTDIFLFSAGCNTQPPLPAPCPDSCDVYGASIDVLLSTTSACPPLSSFQSQPQLYAEVDSRRSILKSAAQGCRDILSSWQTSTYQAHVSKSGFANKGFAPDFKSGVFQTPSSCPAGQFVLGVDADVGSCGFAGNLDAARAYCSDFSGANCCSTLSSASLIASKSAPAPISPLPLLGATPPPPPGSSPRSNLRQSSSLVASSANDSQGSSPSSPSSSLSPVVISCIVLACLVALVVPTILLIRYSNRRKNVNNNGYTRSSGVAPLTIEDPLMKKAGGGGMTAAQMTSSSRTSSSTKKYIVIHEYVQALPDELELRRGDMIDVTSIFDDGWSKGRNLTTGQEGTFPMACLKVVS